MAIRLKDSTQIALWEAARDHFPTYTETNLRKVVQLSTRFLNRIIDETKFSKLEDGTYDENELWPLIACTEFNNKYMFVANRKINNYGVILKFLYANGFLVYENYQSKIGIVKKYRLNLSHLSGIDYTNEALPKVIYLNSVLNTISPELTRSTVGVYKITNKLTGTVYVGSSSAAWDRCHTHIRSLILGCHYNDQLQEDYTLETARSFTFSLIESVDDRLKLRAIEQKWINHYRRVTTVYNVNNACSSKNMKKVAI